jgi:hypothetical protein
MTTIFRCAPVATAISICVGIAASAQAADEVDMAVAACRPLTNLQQRIVDKSELGVDDLRRFVQRTHMIYQLDMSDVADSLDAWRAASTCVKQVAQAKLKQE